MKTLSHLSRFIFFAILGLILAENTPSKEKQGSGMNCLQACKLYQQFTRMGMMKMVFLKEQGLGQVHDYEKQAVDACGVTQKEIESMCQWMTYFYV